MLREDPNKAVNDLSEIEKIAESMNKWQGDARAYHRCPHCGFCPHCGRGGQQYPSRPVPYWQYIPEYQPMYTCSSTGNNF